MQTASLACGSGKDERAEADQGIGKGLINPLRHAQAGSRENAAHPCHPDIHLHWPESQTTRLLCSMKTISLRYPCSWDGVPCHTYASSFTTICYKVIKMGRSKKQPRPPLPRVSFLLLLICLIFQLLLLISEFMKQRLLIVYC